MPDSILETRNTVNGIDIEGVRQMAAGIAADPALGIVGFSVTTAWKQGTRSESTVESYRLAGQTIGRRFTMAHDEPTELLGTNTAPNPQETLMAALNACMTVGYVAGCALRGIRLKSLEIETSGELDLRGFFGIDERVRPGYASLRYEVRIAGDGTPEQFREIHETVIKTSPNYFNLAQPIPLEASLHIKS